MEEKKEIITETNNEELVPQVEKKEEKNLVEENTSNENNEEEIEEKKTTEDSVQEESDTKEMVAIPEFICPIDTGTSEEVTKEINRTREAFLQQTGKPMKIMKIFMTISMITIGILFIISIMYSDLFLVVLSCSTLYLFMLYFISRQIRKKMNAASIDYNITYGKYIDSYVYNNNFMIKDVKLSYKTKIDFKEISKNDIYKDLIATASRDYIVAKFLDVDFYCSDVSYKVSPTGKPKNATVPCVGKLLKFNMRLKEEGKIIIYLSKTKEGKPTNLDGLNEIKVDGLKEDYEVYSSKDDVKGLFTKSVINALNDFESNDLLIDLIINVNDKHLYIVLSYADKIMVLPYREPFEESSLTQYSKDINSITALCTSLLSTKVIEKCGE